MILTTIQRENILFGRPFDEERYWKVVDDTCLLPDLELFADGDMTEVCAPLTSTIVFTETLYFRLERRVLT